MRSIRVVVAADAARGWKLVLAAALLAGCASNARAQLSKERAVAYVRALDIAVLDSSVASGMSLERWFERLAGDAAGLEVVLDDCGEQTGNPALDAGRDFPACATVEATTVEGWTIGVSAVVGTWGRGVVGEPSLRAAYLRCGDTWIRAEGLADLARRVPAARATGAPCGGVGHWRRSGLSEESRPGD